MLKNTTHPCAVDPLADTATTTSDRTYVLLGA